MGIVVHYYTKNISDFNNATRHLTRLERSIYSDLLELQYDIETPLPNDIDWICRRVLAMNEEERTTVERMLNEWFDLVEEGWTNGRVEQEIEIYRSKIEKAKAAGKASGIARRRNKKPNKNNNNEHSLNVRSTNVEPTNNHEQQTTNDQPTNNNQQKNTGGKPPKKTYKDLDYSSWPSMPKPEVLADWMEVRRKKKAANTQTAINGIGKQLHEAAKSGFTVDQCIEEAVTRSWSGFKAEWMCRQSGGQQNEEGRRIDNSAPGRVRAANRRRQIERGEIPDDFSY